MVGITAMADGRLPINRRDMMAGLGAASLGPLLAGRTAAAQDRPSLALLAKADAIALRRGAPDTAIWRLQGPTSDPAFRYRRGDELEITLRNGLPVPALVDWHGIDGAAMAQALTARPPLAPGAVASLRVPLRHAGTFLADLRLLGDGQPLPSSSLALLVAETEAVAVDRDEVLLIEDWRLRPDGSAIAPGTDPKDTAAVYTINGRTSLDIAARTHERFRFRIINGCQRDLIAFKIDGHEIRVMALDGQPAEPFLARNGALVLAPGTRVDAFVDAAVPAGASSAILLHDGKEARPIGRLVASGAPPIRPAPLPAAPPLPSNGLPAKLDLKSALRVELPLGGPQGDWVSPASFATAAAPAFRAKAGRVVVLALTNPGQQAIVFHLHGHHFRLLDRLDDGWKPFWLDTLSIDAGQTQRIAFAAEYAGRFLLEAMAMDWTAPRLVRWYSVE